MILRFPTVGVYLYKVQAGQDIKTQKMTVVK